MNRSKWPLLFLQKLHSILGYILCCLDNVSLFVENIRLGNYVAFLWSIRVRLVTATAAATDAVTAGRGFFTEEDVIIAIGEHLVLWDLHGILGEDILFPWFDIFAHRHVTDGRTGCQRKGYAYTGHKLESIVRFILHVLIHPLAV